MSEIPNGERIILAIDTSDEERARDLAQVAQDISPRGSKVKFGLELSSSKSWEFCSNLANEYGLEWVADAKLDDIPSTVAGAVKNLRHLEWPPFAITMHTTAGTESMRAAQEEAESVKILGVTVLTSLNETESKRIFGLNRSAAVLYLAHTAFESGLSGVVASAKELNVLKRDANTRSLFTMIPGTRSLGADSHDQNNVTTPAEAIRDGADTLVIGRQISQAEDPIKAYRDLITEIEGAI